MKKFKILFFLLIGIGGYCQPTIIDIGIFNDESNGRIDVRIIPNADYDGLYAGVVFTLKWADDIGLTIENPFRNAVGDFAFVMNIRKSGSEFNSGGFNYQKFVGETTTLLSDEFLSLSNGQEFLICSIPYSFQSFRGGVNTRMASEIQLSNDATVVSNNGLHYQEVGNGVEVTGSFFQSTVTFSTLPITLSSFIAEKYRDRDALLNWTSSQEINSSHFMVQRSEDAINFHDIIRVEAAGNSSSQIDYAYLDRNINIQRNTSKLVYYRLKQIDIDGYTDYSEIRALRFDRIGLADVSVYPNPTADVLHLDISDDLLDNQINYEIFDVQGKMVINQQINIKHQKLHLLNLRESGLQSGVYFIKLRNKKELLSSHKFVLISQ
jgi:hypothetical protein